MANIQTISSALKEIQAAYPNWKASEDTIKVWTIYLQDLPDDLLMVAVRKFISSSGTAFPPSIPEIRASASAVRCEAERIPSAIEAWSEVVNAPKPYPANYVVIRGGVEVHTEDYKWSHVMVQTCARRFGWPRFPTGDNDAADRAHFMRAYESMLTENNQHATRLPQINDYVERIALTDDRRAALVTGEVVEIARRMRVAR